MKASAINYLVDAGPLIGLLNESDAHHKWASGVIRSLGEALHTTETVVAEAAHMLKRHRPAVHRLVEGVQGGMIVIMPTLAQNPAAIAEKMHKYPQMDLGDATLVVLSEQCPRAKLITIDRADFTVYRRRDGKPVPCIMPER